MIPVVGGAFNALFCANRRNVNHVLKYFGRVPVVQATMNADRNGPRTEDAVPVSADDEGRAVGQDQEQRPLLVQQQQQQDAPAAVPAVPVAQQHQPTSMPAGAAEPMLVMGQPVVQAMAMPASAVPMVQLLPPALMQMSA